MCSRTCKGGPGSTLHKKQKLEPTHQEENKEIIVYSYSYGRILYTIFAFHLFSLSTVHTHTQHTKRKKKKWIPHPLRSTFSTGVWIWLIIWFSLLPRTRSPLRQENSLFSFISCVITQKGDKGKDGGKEGGREKEKEGVEERWMDNWVLFLRCMWYKSHSSGLAQSPGRERRRQVRRKRREERRGWNVWEILQLESGAISSPELRLVPQSTLPQPLRREQERGVVSELTSEVWNVQPRYR